MKPVNLYFLSRVSNFDLKTFSFSEQALSLRDNCSSIREHEKRDLMKLVNELFSSVNDVKIFDNFYYSYMIPQIGEEFDLLKFKNDKILNIEIKDEMIDKEDILYQLEKNKYYLGHLEKEIIAITYIVSENIFFADVDNMLNQIDKSEVMSILQEFNTDFQIDIDNLFKVSSFLVSPLNTPEKFLNDNYFLTNHQLEIKAQIIEDLENLSARFFQIKGAPGTGKTLLLYDIAKRLSQIGRTCIIHCGILCSGHYYINENSHIDIISAKTAMHTDFNEYDFILVDESHRMYTELFDKIITVNKKVIFSLDANQILSRVEIVRNIPWLVQKLPNLKSFELTKKIRTNKEISAFILRMFDMSKINNNISFKNIEIIYANNVDEAKLIINYYNSNDYKFINYTPSMFTGDKLDSFNHLSKENTHTVIGQEFNNVLMFLDCNFYYENGVLKSYSHPNPNYLYDKLFFQGVTRVREKLAIIVLANPDVYKNLLKIIVNND